ncbi:MAG: DUF4965 domain-containing protein [Phycisphaeraceae bacterium]|nr:DUF4965 domain-containing protein [Phycisphaeraceae bacterium]
MQMMTWTIGRLGGRFNLLFEPYRRRVMHSALGRFLDQPLELTVGMVDPDGTLRTLPFSSEGQPLIGIEQRARFNSITFRGYSQTAGLRFEFNIHSVFYPQVERLCTMPAFYLEMRVNPAKQIRWYERPAAIPNKVKLVLRLRRPDTAIRAAADGQARIDLSYQNTLCPRHDFDGEPCDEDDRKVEAFERIVSLNDGCQVLPEGDGLSLELPVTEQGSGIKWRLVWAAHVAEPVLRVQYHGKACNAVLRYNKAWSNLDQVIHEAVDSRDERLALSRRFEKIVEQAPLDTAQRHLFNQAFQSWLSNSIWCNILVEEGKTRQWFSVLDGAAFNHSPIDVEYNDCLLYLMLWPRLMRLQFSQWAEHELRHEPSNGSYLANNLGRGAQATGPSDSSRQEIEENADFLLMLQAYSHWTGDKSVASSLAGLVERMARYLEWTDRDRSGLPSEGVTNIFDDAGPAMHIARKQTYLAVKRLAAIRAAANLLHIAGNHDLPRRLDALVERDIEKVEQAAWLSDHYAVCTDHSAAGLTDPRSGKPLPFEQLPGWDAYSIHTVNGLLLPTLIGQPPLLNLDRVRKDIIAAARENESRYGCGHTSADNECVWISQNLWRDTLARYLKLTGTVSAQQYWDLQVLSNTHDQSHGYIDTYVNNYLAFHPRGIASIGYLLAGPRLVIDRLAPGGTLISVDPDRQGPRRWPLLALADWKAGKIPICVVDESGHVTIEGQIDPVIIHRHAGLDESISNVEFIG